jgi:hypothetical protein
MMAQAKDARFEAGVQIGALDERGPLFEKPAIAGGRASMRLFGPLHAEAEINRFPIGGGEANFPGTEVLIGARARYCVGPFEIFGKLRPGFIRFDNSRLNGPVLETQPALDLGGGLGIYSRHQLFVRFDLGDVIVFYGHGAGTRSQFQGTFGFGLWF